MVCCDHENCVHWLSVELSVASPSKSLLVVAETVKDHSINLSFTMNNFKNVQRINNLSVESYIIGAYKNEQLSCAQS